MSNVNQDSQARLATVLERLVSQSPGPMGLRVEDIDRLPEKQKGQIEDCAKRTAQRSAFRRFLQDKEWAQAYGRTYKQVMNELKDSITVEEMLQLVPAAFSETMTQAAEPMHPLTQAFTKLDVPGKMMQFYPIVGAVEEPEDVGRSSEYPTRRVAFSGAGFVRMGKVGMRLEIETDLVNEIQGWNILGLVLQAAGMAFGRKKERKCAAHLTDSGTILFDNLSANYYNTSGVNPSGAQNGTFTMQDLVTMCGDLIDNGFIPDTIIMNGMAWGVFATVPELRDLVKAGVGGRQMYQLPQGQGGVHPQGPANPLSAVWTPAPALATTYVNPDSSITGQATRTIISPYMRMATGSSAVRLTDIIVADSRYLGALLQGRPMGTEEFDDPRFDVRSIKMREDYAVASLAQGKGIRVAKNVALQRGLDPWNLQFTAAPGESLIYSQVKSDLGL